MTIASSLTTASSPTFRDLLKKIAGGPHTSKDLSREEAALALAQMLTDQATPAQIGAFLIAHRMKRPTGVELAGMLDTYDRLGCKLKAIDSAYLPLVLGCPYDGRKRTFPLVPLTALILASAGCPVILHGGDRIPPKYGVSLVELWQGLGVDWTSLSLEQIQQTLESQSLALVYQPRHFPISLSLIAYREELGKRPPVATLELMWSPYAGPARLAVGYVHPPTEQLIVDALQTRGVEHFLMVKGWEGSVDLPGNRPAIVQSYDAPQALERLPLHPEHYGIKFTDQPFSDVVDWVDQVQGLLDGSEVPLAELYDSVRWNAGFYLWRSGVTDSLEAGITLTADLLRSGQVRQKLLDLQRAYRKNGYKASPF
jgi:anthranilate phosphoribosyltransferase